MSSVFGGLVTNFMLWLGLFTLAYNLWVIATQFKIVKFAWKTNKGMCLPLIPLFGTSGIGLIAGSRRDVLKPFLWAADILGYPFNFWFGHHYHYVTNDAEEVNAVSKSSKSLDKLPAYHSANFILNNTILVTNGDEWKPRRRYLRPAFNTASLKMFFGTFVSLTEKLIVQLETINAEDDIYQVFNFHAFRSFFFTSAGYHGKDLDVDTRNTINLIDRLQYQFTGVIFNPLAFLLQHCTFGPLTGILTESKKLKETIKCWMTDIVNERNKPHSGTQNSGTPLVDLLYSDEYKELKASDVTEDMIIFLVEATDTTGHTLSLLFTLLGMYQEVQEKVYQEVLSVMGNSEIHYEDLPKLTYTEAVINETMRLFPIIPVIGRTLREDINCGKKTIPKGTSVVFSMVGLHRNPEYWGNPLRFDPSRFLPDNLSKIVPGSFIPFSLGPRDCIGKNFAMALMKITVAYVVRRFKITTKHKSIEEFDLESCVVLHTANHLDCVFTRRAE